MAEPVSTEELERMVATFHEYALAITKALTGLVGGGSEMFAGRIAKGTPHEMFKADIPFCINRIRERLDAVHEERKDLAREALANRKAGEWRPIAEAPKDGTPIDVWSKGQRHTDVFWGSPKSFHSCGEYGRYCDSCPPDKEMWLDPIAPMFNPGLKPEYYKPLPAPPLPLTDAGG